MKILSVFNNEVLILALISWLLAQILKVPIGYVQTQQWNWSLLLEPGGMPSSHAALVTAATHAIGLWQGFDSALFGFAFVITMIVVYDATGIRWQAGKHAEVINRMIQELAAGHPLKGQELREVLGHTPLEALAGVLLGLFVSQIGWMLVN